MINDITPPGSLSAQIDIPVEDPPCLQDEQERRLSLCQQCPNLIVNEVTVCGVVNNQVGRMITIEHIKCPIGNW